MWPWRSDKIYWSRGQLRWQRDTAPGCTTSIFPRITRGPFHLTGCRLWKETRGGNGNYEAVWELMNVCTRRLRPCCAVSRICNTITRGVQLGHIMDQCWHPRKWMASSASMCLHTRETCLLSIVKILQQTYGSSCIQSNFVSILWPFNSIYAIV